MSTHQAAPRDRKTLAAVGLLVAALTLTLLVLGIVAWSAYAGTIVGESGAGRLLLLILDSKVDSRLITLGTAILGVGSAYVAGGNPGDRLFYLVVVEAALGIVLCISLFMMLNDETVARNIYNYASERLADSQSFATAANLFLGGTSLWLAGVLGVQVGLHSGGQPPSVPAPAPPPVPAASPAPAPAPAPAPEGDAGV